VLLLLVNLHLASASNLPPGMMLLLVEIAANISSSSVLSCERFRKPFAFMLRKVSGLVPAVRSSSRALVTTASNELGMCPLAPVLTLLVSADNLLEVLSQYSYELAGYL
jgi:hypothetical protein